MKQSVRPLTARLHRLNIRLDQKEWDKVHKLTSNSTCRSVSEYARKVLLEKPVRVFYRNQSFDDIEERMVGVLAQLEGFGDNFNRLVKKSLSMDMAGISSIVPELLDYQRQFLATADQIKAHIEKLADLCDPK
jgi:hypothetical protein